jgi:hypothetical protein
VKKLELWKNSGGRGENKWFIGVTFRSFTTPIGKAGSGFGLRRLTVQPKMPTCKAQGKPEGTGLQRKLHESSGDK